MEICGRSLLQRRISRGKPAAESRSRSDVGLRRTPTQATPARLPHRHLPHLPNPVSTSSTVPLEAVYLAGSQAGAFEVVMEALLAASGGHRQRAEPGRGVDDSGDELCRRAEFAPWWATIRCPPSRRRQDLGLGGERRAHEPPRCRERGPRRASMRPPVGSLVPGGPHAANRQPGSRA